jgi:hypothetical protein
MFYLARQQSLLSAIIALNLTLALPVLAGNESELPPATASNPLDLNPEIINNSPVLQRWLEKVPNVLEEIEDDPSFRTLVKLGYTEFPSTQHRGGVSVGIEDVFLGKTGLTLSGNYQGSFNGDRELAGGDLKYYILPLGNYVNIAPAVGYRYFQTNNYSTDGVNVGMKVMFTLSRTGAADISLTQSFISPGGDNEVGLSTLSVGYAIAPRWRLSTEIQKQNSRVKKDSSVGIFLEWMP